LKFSDRTWRALSKPWQSRLRASDFSRLHQKAGWHIISEDVELAPEWALNEVRLAKRFQQYTPRDLRVIRSRIVSAPMRSFQPERSRSEITESSTADDGSSSQVDSADQHPNPPHARRLYSRTTQ
jgi:hypothetical protein